MAAKSGLQAVAKSVSRLTFWNRAGYGVGGLASNLIYQMVGVYILYFYTDVLGIPGVAISTLLLITRVWDAVNDPLMGMISDRTRSRWGKFRPYLLYGAVPLALVYILAFITPPVDVSLKVAFAYVTYILLDFGYTLVNVPYSSLQAAITQDTHERSALSASMLFFSNIGVLIVGVATKPLVAMFPSEQVGFPIVVTGYAVIALIFFVVCFFANKETVEVKEQKYSLKEAYQLILRNTPLLLLCLALLFVGMSSNMRIASAVYYFKYNLGRDDLFPIFMLLVILTSAVATLFTPAISNRMGSKRNAYFIGVLTYILGDAGIFFTPYNQVGLIFAFAIVAGLGTGITSVLIWSMVADTVEYGEWKTGTRGEGIVYSTFMFMTKLSSALGGAISGIILTATGYIPNVAQPPAVLTGFLMMIALFPIVAGLAAFAILWFYRLDDSLYNKILMELKARKESAK